MAAPQRILVGLGNPGARYVNHRHNIGFMSVDAIANRHRLSPGRQRFGGVTAEGEIGGVPVMTLKPQTFMNESGRSVGAAAHFFKRSANEMIVFHDELDLAAGKVRVKRGGGAAGHNGLRSIDAHIGNDYWRVRLGIGHPGDKTQVVGHVLKDFAAADRDWLQPLLAAVAEHVGFLLAGDSAGFLNKVAIDLKPPVRRSSNGDTNPNRESNSGV